MRVTLDATETFRLQQRATAGTPPDPAPEPADTGHRANLRLVPAKASELPVRRIRSLPGHVVNAHRPHPN